MNNKEDAETDSPDTQQVESPAQEVSETEDHPPKQSTDPEPNEAAQDKVSQEDIEPNEVEQVEKSTPSVAQPKSGRGVAWFALLIALLGVGGAGYLGYERFYQDPVGQLQSQVEQLAGQNTSDSQRLQADLAAQEVRVNQLITEAQTQQQAQLDMVQTGVIDSLNDALRTAPPSQRQWKLAEAEYLLRIGNHRVLMEHDSQGALSLFLAADQILAEIDDFSLHEIRAILADEIIALRAVPSADLQGVYLRLEALKGRLDKVILKAPEFVPEVVEEVPEQTMWQQFVSAAEELVRVRNLSGDETLTPLLAPQEQQYLELNLRLALQQAQLAALRRQQEVYVQALQNVAFWLTRYGVDDGGVLAQEIEALQGLELSHPLPDVSASLRALRSLVGGAE